MKNRLYPDRIAHIVYGWPVLICLCCVLSLLQVSAQQLTLRPIGTYRGGDFDEGAAEISAYDAPSQHLFLVNGDRRSLDILTLSDPTSPTLVRSIPMSPYGKAANSVAVKNGLVAVAVESEVKTDTGIVAFFDTEGRFLQSVSAGALPDMVTFTPKGDYVVVANEGEPNDDYSIDPEGSLTIIDLRRGLRRCRTRQVSFRRFNRFKNLLIRRGLRVYGPGATLAQDLEPEYIALSPNGRKAYVSLQENNAYAIVNVPHGKVLRILPFGTKNHNDLRNGFDASNRDDSIRIRPWPVKGMYMPDALAMYPYRGRLFLLSANEGDARDYDGFSEEARVGDLVLDPRYFPDTTLQDDRNLGRLKISTASGDSDGDGVYEQLFAYGGRSFSIWKANSGRQVFDSGDDFEQIIATELPEAFNTNNDDNDSFDARSDDKGPEPEGVVTGTVQEKTYAFIGLERVGGVMVYDISHPYRPTFVTYVNNRDFSVDEESPQAGDLGPEGLTFVAAKDSPNGQALLIVSNEVSGTLTVFEARPGLGEDNTGSVGDTDVLRVKVYPVPFRDVLNIDLQGDRFRKIMVRPLFGNGHQRYTLRGITNDRLTLNLEKMPDGLLVVFMVEETGRIHTRLVKKGY